MRLAPDDFLTTYPNFGVSNISQPVNNATAAQASPIRQRTRAAGFLCSQAVVLDSAGPLNFSSRTLYMRVENASSLHLGDGFLSALRRYYSVAVDLWSIGNVTFAAEFRPKHRFLFMGKDLDGTAGPLVSWGLGMEGTGWSIGPVRTATQ